MTDKELLEKAAKIAGIDGVFSRFHQAYGDMWVEGVDYGGRLFWNSLEDDGDALRLAVRVGMFDGSLFSLFMRFRLEETQSNPSRGDEEITRRAITRVAVTMYEDGLSHEITL